MSQEPTGKTAAEAGWHLSRYNLSAKLPGTDKLVIANLFCRTCHAYSPLEVYLLSVLDELDEHHPILKHFARRGLIVNFDEAAVLESASRAYSCHPGKVAFTICPTMACNFDCPYCFEKHRTGRMSPKVQDDIAALAGRMLDASGAKRMSVNWFGGEPLLAPDIIESLSERLMAAAEDRRADYSTSIITNGYLLTQDIVDMLARFHVKYMQITLDGIGAAHDATRHLTGGGGTFERIMENLGSLSIPFKVTIRQNVHEGNFDEYEKLCAAVRDLAEKTGNTLYCFPTEVKDNPAAQERRDQTELLGKARLSRVGIERDVWETARRAGGYCFAQSLWGLAIDDKGNLYKCEEIVDKPEQSFGTAAEWDPGNPFQTACRPDQLTAYLNTCGSFHSAECRDCIWLPVCQGGCPNRRLSGKRVCLSYKDYPEEYVLALYTHLMKDLPTADFK